MLQDAAARALWLLVKGDKKCLAAEEGLLGCDPLQLAGQLVGLIEAAEAEEVRECVCVHVCLCAALRRRVGRGRRANVHPRGR